MAGKMLAAAVVAAFGLANGENVALAGHMLGEKLPPPHGVVHHNPPKGLAAVSPVLLPLKPDLGEYSGCGGCAPRAKQQLLPLSFFQPHKPTEAPKPDNCKCLNWKEVFLHRDVKCGNGYELFMDLAKDEAKGTSTISLAKFGSPAQVREFKTASELFAGEICNKLYSRLDDNSCVNSHMGQAPEHWCYVDSQCYNYTGGKRVRTDNGQYPVNLKLCKEGEDVMLWTRSPDQLERLAKKHGIDMGHLVKMAYPTVQGEYWEDVQSFFASKTPEEEQASKKVRQIALTGQPVIYASIKGRPPFGVTMGMQAYEVDLKLAARKLLMNHPDSIDAWSNVTKFRCLYGCPIGTSTAKTHLHLRKRAKPHWKQLGNVEAKSVQLQRSR